MYPINILTVGLLATISHQAVLAIPLGVNVDKRDGTELMSRHPDGSTDMSKRSLNDVTNSPEIHETFPQEPGPRGSGGKENEPPKNQKHKAGSKRSLNDVTNSPEIHETFPQEPGPRGSGGKENEPPKNQKHKAGSKRSLNDVTNSPEIHETFPQEPGPRGSGGKENEPPKKSGRK